MLAPTGSCRNAGAESLADARYLKADETRHLHMRQVRRQYRTRVGGERGRRRRYRPRPGRRGHTAAISRGALVLGNHIAPYKPITCDGYVVYKSFKTRQRCMAHIIREARFLKEAHKKIPELAAFHKSLQHHDAKLLQRQSDDAPMVDTGSMVAGELAIASEYDGYEVGKDYATYLRNAAPNMFIFVNHPGMQSTNNDTERVVRKVVLSRKVRLRIVSAKGRQNILDPNDMPHDVEEAGPQHTRGIAEELVLNLTSYADPDADAPGAQKCGARKRVIRMRGGKRTGHHLDVGRGPTRRAAPCRCGRGICTPRSRGGSPPLFRGCILILALL